MTQMDRRKSKRVPLVVDIYYSVERPPELKIKFGDRVETAYLVDISSSGIGFTCGTELPVNTELDITFNLAALSGEVVKIKVLGVVRYCSFHDDRQIFRIGLVFTVIDEREKGLIAEFVKNLQKDSA